MKQSQSWLLQLRSRLTQSSDRRAVERIILTPNFLVMRTLCLIGDFGVLINCSEGNRVKCDNTPHRDETPLELFD